MKYQIKGEPMPVVFLENGEIHVLDDDELPLELPELEDYKGKNGQAPLENAVEWKQYEHNGMKGLRETSTMPGSAGSSWYYFRYIDPDNEKDFMAGINNMKALSMYDTGVDAQWGDRLITLSTCDYEQDNGRFVVVAKLIGY